MRKILRIELKRAFESNGFIFAFLVGLAICVYQFITYGYQSVDTYADYLAKGINFPMMAPSSFYVRWIGGELNSFSRTLLFLVMPILATLPHGRTYYDDKNTGLIRTFLGKTKARNYYISKWIAVFLSAGTVVIVPIIVNILLTMITNFMILPRFETRNFMVHLDSIPWVSDLFYSSPNLYILMYLALVFVVAGLIGTASLSFTILVNKSFMPLLGPFFVYMMLNMAAIGFSLPKLSLVSYLDPSTGLFTLPITLGFVVLLFAIGTVPLMLVCKNRSDF